MAGLLQPTLQSLRILLGQDALAETERQGDGERGRQGDKETETSLLVLVPRRGRFGLVFEPLSCVVADTKDDQQVARRLLGASLGAPRMAPGIPSPLAELSPSGRLHRNRWSPSSE